ncbi:transcription factor HES-1-like [Planococcus citri]|uniref:transcription factor HES-1-like n=1 Tax=Planococcus citri TaxID=170843 RepID=UPI0031F9703A
MDTKQDFSLKRSGASDTFDSEDDDSSSTCKKSKLSKIINEDKNQKFSSIVDARKEGLSPTPKKANKPLMEKRRRARINQSLALLKTLILDSTKNDNTRHSKLEKADILELTVRYLQRQKILNSEELDKYKAGFQECTREVTRFLDTPELHLCNNDSSKSSKHHSSSSSKQPNSIFIEPAVKQRLLRHLNSCSSEIDLDFSKSSTLQKNQSGATELSTEVCPTPPYTADEITPPQVPKKEPLNTRNGETNFPTITAEVPEFKGNEIPPKNSSLENNDDSTLSVVQVIPSRLSDGQVVFLLPSHYMQLAEEFHKKTAFHRIMDKHGNGTDANEPIDFSIKREDYMWRPW